MSVKCMQEASEIQRNYFRRVCDIIPCVFGYPIHNMFAEFEYYMNGYSPCKNISSKHWANWIKHVGTFLQGFSAGSNEFSGSKKKISMAELENILRKECMVPDEGIYVFDFQDAGPLSLQPHKMMKESVFCKDCYMCNCGTCHSCKCSM